MYSILKHAVDSDQKNSSLVAWKYLRHEFCVHHRQMQSNVFLVILVWI